MAKNTRQIMDADYCVSFTGNAGPSAMEGKPAGCVYCAIAGRNQIWEYHFQYQNIQRNELRMQVVDKMIQELLLRMENEHGKKSC
jgi:nicotinamide mononucleotide (NMN) deamidase PncC